MLNEVTTTVREKVTYWVAGGFTGFSAFAEGAQLAPVNPEEFYFNPSLGIAVGAFGVLVNALTQAFRLYKEVLQHKRDEDARDEISE